MNDAGNLHWSDERIEDLNVCAGRKGRERMPFVFECGVTGKIFGKRICFVEWRCKNFRSMEERRNGGLVAVQDTIGNSPKVS